MWFNCFSLKPNVIDEIYTYIHIKLHYYIVKFNRIIWNCCISNVIYEWKCPAIRVVAVVFVCRPLFESKYNLCIFFRNITNFLVAHYSTKIWDLIFISIPNSCIFGLFTTCRYSLANALWETTRRCHTTLLIVQSFKDSLCRLVASTFFFFKLSNILTLRCQMTSQSEDAMRWVRI